MSSRLHRNPAFVVGHTIGAVLFSSAAVFFLYAGFVLGFALDKVLLLVLCALLAVRFLRLAVLPFVVLERDGLVVRMPRRTHRVPLGDIAALDHRVMPSHRRKGNWFTPVLTRTDGTELDLVMAVYRVDSRYQWRVQDFIEEVERRRPVRAHGNRDASSGADGVAARHGEDIPQR